MAFFDEGYYTDEKRLETYLNGFHSNCTEIKQLPPPIILFASCMRFLLHHSQPMLFEWQLHALIILVLVCSCIRLQEIIKNSRILSDAIHIGSLYQVLLYHAFLVNQVCGFPLGDQLSAADFFDGEKWMAIYDFMENYARKKRYGGNENYLEELLLSTGMIRERSSSQITDLKERFEKIRGAILQELDREKIFRKSSHHQYQHNNNNNNNNRKKNSTSTIQVKKAEPLFNMFSVLDHLPN